MKDKSTGTRKKRQGKRDREKWNKKWKGSGDKGDKEQDYRGKGPRKRNKVKCVGYNGRGHNGNRKMGMAQGKSE